MKTKAPANSYTVNLEVRLENLAGNPRWDSVAEALQQQVFDLPQFRAGGGTVYIAEVDVDTASEG